MVNGFDCTRQNRVLATLVGRLVCCGLQYRFAKLPHKMPLVEYLLTYAKTIHTCTRNVRRGAENPCSIIPS